MHGDITETGYVLNSIHIRSNAVKFAKSGKIVWGKSKRDSVAVSFQTEPIAKKVVPNVLGMGAKDAVYLLEYSGLRTKMTGMGKVCQQSLVPGSRLSAGQTIHLTLKQ